MKTSTIALLALGALASFPAWSQQSATSGSSTTTTTTGTTRTPGMSSSGTTLEETWRAPGDPAGAAQTTQAYVPNRDVVSAVEQRLQQLGYNVTPDGQYDAELRNNVLVFQSDHGLRPTGNVDLATIGALGINVQPVGTTTAMAPTATMVEEVAVLPPGYEFPLERTEHMSAPQVMRQSEQLETTTGLELSEEQLSAVPAEHPPGFPPGFPVQDIIDFN